MDAFVYTILFDVIIMVAVIYAMVLLFSFVGFLSAVHADKKADGERRLRPRVRIGRMPYRFHNGRARRRRFWESSA